ncbi:immunoglobulin superfamily member 5 [Embiotoca jacksoni]|uniref:immunoglobulin superfamily member 5 n=1 Tax=Embiotoca jacksoni TaxID=100190 RepID=UPI003704872F
MTVSWKSWASLHISSLLCASGVVLGQFQLEPLNATVLQGSDIQFNATVPGKWQVMTWTVQKLLVLTVSTTSGIIPSSEQFSARYCSSEDTSCVEFTIYNVTRRESGPVTCSIQGNFGQKTSQLHVQESGVVSIMGGNVTAVQDQHVEFQCVTTAWLPIPTVTWTRNGEAVDSSLFNTTSMTDGDSFNSTSVLQFQAVRKTTVKCLATIPTLEKPQSSSVFLVVVPEPPDWTVLIAVVVSFGGAALLVLLILAIIFCYTRRKEKKSNYQDEMRMVRTQSQLSGVDATWQRQGQVNAASEGQTSVTPSELTDSGFFQANGPNIFEVPDVVNSNQAGNFCNNANNSMGESGFKKHRHVTIV